MRRIMFCKLFVSCSVVCLLLDTLFAVIGEYEIGSSRLGSL